MSYVVWCGVVYFASGMERKRVSRKSFLFLGEILTQSHNCERHQRLCEGGRGERKRERNKEGTGSDRGGERETEDRR